MRPWLSSSSAVALAFLSSPARAQADEPTPTRTAPPPVGGTGVGGYRGTTVGTEERNTRVAPSASQEIVVTARRLDAARASIQPALGSTSYTITNATIQAQPGGDNQQFNQVLLQLPSVVQDGFGQFHVRDDHNNLQYRINGTILPEGIVVFGQTLTPRIVQNVSLVTGALPAQ